MDWRSITVLQMGMSLVDLVVILFLALVGANLGSFLNVVAHRVPLGMSVVFGGSRCPACGQAGPSQIREKRLESHREMVALPARGLSFVRLRTRSVAGSFPLRSGFRILAGTDAGGTL